MAGRPKRTNYTPRNPSKYRGTYPITLRSSWEVSFAQKCDLTPTILEWASEPIEIPYRNPLKQKQSIYIPDFMIKAVNTQGIVETKLIEIKPAKEALAEKAVSEYDKMSLMVNQAKWLAASAWCARRGIKFVVLTNEGMFVNTAPSKMSKPKKPGKIGTIKKKKPIKAKKGGAGHKHVANGMRVRKSPKTRAIAKAKKA